MDGTKNQPHVVDCQGCGKPRYDLLWNMLRSAFLCPRCRKAPVSKSCGG